MTRRDRPKRDALRFIEAQVPLIRGEPAHSWQFLMVHGCSTCGEHAGFECLTCKRVVDYEHDTPLYEAIALLLEPDQ